jgi:hypothetical protein
MTSKSQSSLFPESGNEMRSALHRLEPVAGELADFADGIESALNNAQFID